MSDPAIVEVRGGVAGTTACYEDLLALAEAWESTAGQALGWAGTGARVLLDADLLSSCPLAPWTFATAEHAVLAATAGPDGVGRLAAGWETDALSLRAVVAGLRAADAAVAGSFGSLGLAVATAPTWLPAAADVLGRLYPDGRVVGHPLPVAVPASHRAPRGVRDLVEHLAELSALSGPGHPERNGTLEVQTLHLPDGRVRHVVYLPGTDDMTTLPWSRDGDVRDMGANVELAASADSDYARGVLDALSAAGVGPDEPVLVAGHSQGGLLAARLVGAEGFSIDDAVTLGAPIAQVDLPRDARLLALEHRSDVVPLLDAGANPDTRGEVTVVFDTDAGADTDTDTDTGHDTGGLARRHGFPAYAAGAALVDATSDPSVAAALRHLEDAGFLAAPPGTVVTSQVVQLVRRP